MHASFTIKPPRKKNGALSQQKHSNFVSLGSTNVTNAVMRSQILIVLHRTEKIAYFKKVVVLKSTGRCLKTPWKLLAMISLVSFEVPFAVFIELERNGK